MGARFRRAVLVVALLATGLPTIAHAESGTLLITEFMASNDTTLMDGTGEFSDWIEIHNPGVTAVDLAGWALTDDAGNLAKWVFPSLSLAPDAYLVVFASSPATTPPPGELHTGFGLSAGGEYLGLVEADGVTVASEYAPEFPAQSTDISFGISSAGGLSYFASPTPGAPNGVGEGLPVAPPAFSIERGFYDTAVDVALTSATVGSTIYYTTDGSEPTTASAAYSAPVPVTSTTTLRAVALRDGWVDSPIETHTYIFVDDVLNQPAVIAGYPNNFYSVGYGSPVQHDNEMDPAVVAAYSSEVNTAMTAIPTVSIVVDPAEIFGDTGFYDGEDVIREASIEVLYPSDPGSNHQAETGIESHSHDRLKRSIRLTFKTEYGDTFFDTDLFQNAPLNGDTATDYIKRIVLRGGNNRAWSRVWHPDDTTFTEDQFYRDTQLALSGDGARGTFAHLYINGIYWGMYNPVERPDEHFTSEYLGGDNDDWYFRNHGSATDGDPTRYLYLKNTLVDEDLTDPVKFSEFEEYLDIDHFIDYLLTTWYQGVSDWPQNNWYYGNRTDTSPLGSTPGRFYAWDGESSWDTVNGFPTPPNGPWVHPLFREGEDGNGYLIGELWHAARANDDFMDRFANRVHQHVSGGGALSDAAALARWQALNDSIGVAVIGESARWGDSLGDGTTRTRDVEWQAQVDDIADILDGSAAQLIAVLRAEGFYPAFDAPVFSQDGGPIDPGFDLSITNPGGSGTVYFTTDGSDPRGPGGSVGATATAYTAPIDLTTTTTVQARVENGGDWSALTTAQFVVVSPLRITEMHYHALDPTPAEIAAGYLDSDQFDFIEVLNTGPVPVDLDGVAFTEGVFFTFPAMTLNPGAYITVVHNQAAFESRNGTGINIAGMYTNKLSNGGEEVILEDAFGVTVHSYTYDDKDPWPESPDGDGPSLEVIDTEASYSDPTNWEASVYAGGSPGSPPLIDITAPVITLLGADPQTITQGDPYVELGATAQDDADGDITASIFVDASAVDTATVGQYDVTYNVSDAAGNPATQVGRTVDVVAVVTGLLRVTSSPAVPTQVMVDGVPADSWGLTWVKIPVGDHEVSFTDIQGFTTPTPQLVTVVEDTTTTVNGTFIERGWLQVTTSPAVPATIYVDGNPMNDWGMWTDLEPGTYEVCFGDVADYITPACETVDVLAGTNTPVEGVFVSDPGAPAPSGHGYLRVTTDPAVPAQILIDGIPRDSWGLNWVKLDPGAYQVAFTDIQGFTTPDPQGITITAGQTTGLEAIYGEHAWLRVITSPAVAGTVYLDGAPMNDWGVWTHIEAGIYEVCFGAVPGFSTPDCTIAGLITGVATTITGEYTPVP